MSAQHDLLLGPLDQIGEVARACASTHPHAVFGAVDTWVKPLLQQSLCTVNRYTAATDTLTRLYSSDPVSYPVGGSKNKSGLPWGRHVLHERRIFIGEGVEAIRQSFDDYATIQALGLKSVINVPIVFQDVCLGTLNLLMQTPSITETMVQHARLAALLATPGFLTLPGK